MRQAAAPTLSQHLLLEANRFLFYPQPGYRSRVLVATQKALDDGLRRLLEWRTTFAPKVQDPAMELLSSTVMMDQMYCRNLLRNIPGIVERTQALITVVMSDISTSESFVYLREAATCYISGLPQAAVALSRAAVENRVKQVCAKAFGKQAVADSDFIALTDDFSARGQILSKDGRYLAHVVRQAGNDVLHNKPTTSAMALGVFEGARRVIQLLHGK